MPSLGSNELKKKKKNQTCATLSGIPLALTASIAHKEHKCIFCCLSANRTSVF